MTDKEDIADAMLKVNQQMFDTSTQSPQDSVIVSISNLQRLCEENKYLRARVAELLNTRADNEDLNVIVDMLHAEIKRLNLTIGDSGAWAIQTMQELDALRAEVERLRNHINSAETAFAVELGALRLSLKQVDAVVDDLRADLRDALDLLHNPEIGHQEWISRSRRLGEKYKETP